MTPEQRLNRVERILGLFVAEGRRWRVRAREQDDKINMLIQTQMETSEQIKDLTASQKQTDRVLRAFIQESRHGSKRSNLKP